MPPFNLRPVVDNSPPTSPTDSATPDGHSPRYKHRPTSPSINGPRRPLSPSSLRDVDLTQADHQLRSRFPTPPTGHELMSLFPPPPPECPPETRPGPTSGFFQRQERAFFSQAGKEIVRVRLEVDMPPGSPDAEVPKSKVASSSRWAGHPGQGGTQQSPIPPPSNAPGQLPQLFPHPGSRQSQRGTVPVTPLYPISSHPPPPHPANLPPPAHHQRTPPLLDPSQSGPNPPKLEYQHDEYDDERWKRPTPYAERRRAGKHTKRVIVRT